MESRVSPGRPCSEKPVFCVTLIIPTVRLEETSFCAQEDTASL